MNDRYLYALLFWTLAGWVAPVREVSVDSARAPRDPFTEGRLL